MAISKDQLSEAGFQARDDAHRKTREALDSNKIDEFYAAKHLKRLSTFKVQKAQYEKTAVKYDKKTGKILGVAEGYWTYSKKLDDGGVQLKAVDILAHLLQMYSPEKFEHTGKDGGPIECVSYTDLERANRLNFMIQEAIKRKKEGATSATTNSGKRNR